MRIEEVRWVVGLEASKPGDVWTLCADFYLYFLAAAAQRACFV